MNLTIDPTLRLTNFQFHVSAHRAFLRLEYSNVATAVGAQLQALPESYRAAAMAFATLPEVPVQVSIDDVALELDSFRSGADGDGSTLIVEYRKEKS